VYHHQKALVVDWYSIIAAAASFRQDFGLKKWGFVCQEQKNDFQKFLTPQ